MKFVDDWKESWKWFSMQALALAFVWETLSDEYKQAIFLLVPDTLEPHVTSILLVLGLLGRVVDQNKGQPGVDTQ